MTDDRPLEDLGEDLEDDGVLDASDTLEGDPGDDPLDPGIIPADRWSAGERYGTTLSEERAGESLDQLLAEEEPEPDPYADDGLSPSGPSGRASGDADEEWGDEDVDGLLLDDGADPRAGRLVAPDEGAHPDTEADLIGRDVGIDAGAASAEEAAVHIVYDDDRDVRSDE
jgi:Family of unknown function (DUF5709)